MSRTLYLECGSGISGDMFVAALLDLGADFEALKEALSSLDVEGYTVSMSRKKKSGLDVCDFEVKLDKDHENQDHDMEYLHGCVGAHRREQEAQSAGGHHHGHWGLAEILHLIEKSSVSPRAKRTASDIFHIVGEAEAEAHGVELKDVHFHEVGAVDSIVDIVAAAVCLDDLDVTDVIVEELCEGRGTVRCQHGVIPVPVPAVVNIAKKYKIPLKITNVQGELVTPTGAAIAAAIRTRDRLSERFVIEKVGMGAGKREYETPGILRAMIIKSECEKEEDGWSDSDTIWKLETNIDDCSGEALGYAMDRLLEAGALDVTFAPIYMKKNRPAYEVDLLCVEDKVAELEQILFEETTTIGIRKIKMDRTVLKRSIQKIKTSLGEATVKECALPGGKRTYAEHDEILRLCKEHGLSYPEVRRIIENR